MLCDERVWVRVHVSCFNQVRWFDTQAGLFDCAWSECHPRQLATAGAGNFAARVIDWWIDEMKFDKLRVRHFRLYCAYFGALLMIDASIFYYFR